MITWENFFQTYWSWSDMLVYFTQSGLFTHKDRSPISYRCSRYPACNFYSNHEENAALLTALSFMMNDLMPCMVCPQSIDKTAFT
jgi:ssDNA-binding Zn-finger/Zn-ribbon topoisomerase 1